LSLIYSIDSLGSRRGWGNVSIVRRWGVLGFTSGLPIFAALGAVLKVR
jgi:hypothetical protein